MKEKLNNSINIFIIVVFILAVVYGIYAIIKNAINNYNDRNKTFIESNENIEDYIIDVNENIMDENGEMKASNLVQSYSTFYTVQDALQNYIQYLIDQKYADTYSILSGDIRSKYSKEEYVQKIATYSETHFNTKNGYVNNGKLRKAYEIKQNTYICDVENINGEMIRIGIALNPNSYTYKVFYIEL